VATVFARDASPWLRRAVRDDPADVRLFCFHHAGGSAASFRDWPDLMPPHVEPVAVQLPGRGDRLREPPFERMASLVDGLVTAVRPLLDQPFAFYGLSMGAYVAWALAHALRERALPGPTLLCVANARAPGRDNGGVDWEALTVDPARYLREMGGTPREVLADPELLAFLLPTLRADLTVIDTYRFRPPTPLDVPIRAFAGVDDAAGPPERMRVWRHETVQRFEFDIVSGGHFFDVPGLHHVVRTIAGELAGEPSTPS
jgi:surfactin synthase thioesterase subunit